VKGDTGEDQIIAIHFEQLSRAITFLLTLDEDPPSVHNGITRLNAIDFLLNERH
jgi:hypothetical protein